MTKYSKSFRLAVAQHYQQSSEGSTATAKRFGIDSGSVRRWSAAYEQHGPEGLRCAGGRYSTAFKRQVLSTMESKGWSVRHTCAMFKIAASTTVRKWQRDFAQGGIAALESKRSKRRTRMAKHKPHSPPLPERRKAKENMTPDELHERLAYLEAENAYLKKLKALAQEKRSAEKKRRD